GLFDQSVGLAFSLPRHREDAPAASVKWSQGIGWVSLRRIREYCNSPSEKIQSLPAAFSARRAWGVSPMRLLPRAVPPLMGRPPHARRGPQTGGQPAAI